MLHCRFFHTKIMSNSALWRQLCQRDFGVDIAQSCNSKVYRSLWRAHQQGVCAVRVAEMKLQQCQESVVALTEELTRTQVELQAAQTRMLSATAQQLPDSPVSPRELLLHSIVQAKLAQSPTGVIQARGERGRPVSLIKMTAADKPSDQASQKSLKRRS